MLFRSHDNIPLLRAAVADAQKRGCEVVMHCGDIVAPSTLATIQRYGLPIYAIHGNNTGDLYTMSRLSHKTDSLIHYYGQDAAFTLAGKRIFLVHYPHYAKAMAVTAEYDLVCCGHTHSTEITHIANIAGNHTVMVNPGTVGGVGGVAPTYIIGDLETLEFEVVQVPTETNI